MPFRSGVERFHSDHYVLIQHRSYLELLRSDVPLNLESDLFAAHRLLIEELELTREWGLLVDLRRTPPRLEPGFQAKMTPFRQALMEGQKRVAVLLSSQVGKLEVQRHLREDGSPKHMRAFCDESAAVAFASGPAS